MSSLRKDEHLEIASLDVCEGPLTTWLEYVDPIHLAITEVDPDSVDTSVEFLGYKLSLPLVIAPITGGTRSAYEINKALAEVAYEKRIAVSLGSARPLIENKANSEVLESFKIVRKIASDIPVIANIGAIQLTIYGPEAAERIVSVCEADALSIHLNPLQEIAQPEGDKLRVGVVKAIARTIEKLDVPIIVKEVGFGLSRECTEVLRKLGVKMFDVAGAGGTNWLCIELVRRRLKGSEDEALYTFLSWGIPTAAAIAEVRDAAPDAVVIAGGGIRTGLDVFKAIAIGADLASIARPLVVARDNQRIKRLIDKIWKELRIAMALTGCRSVDNVKSCPIVVRGNLAYWICARRLKPRNRNIYMFCIVR